MKLNILNTTTVGSSFNENSFIKNLLIDNNHYNIVDSKIIISYRLNHLSILKR